MGHNFSYVNTGSRGVNTLAYNLLQGQMSYPSYVILTKNGEITNILRGYFDSNEFIEQF